jgi:GNAT superfamily N-acetyltransferase
VHKKMEQRIEVTTYFLEMRSLPAAPALPCPDDAEIVAAPAISAQDYLALYQSVGEPWLWYERSELGEDALAKLIGAPDVSIYLLQQRGVTAGFCELQTSPPQQTQLLYFGLMPAFIGAGLGSYFLDWTVRRAFESNIDRLWVHTCSLDHPRALASYERAGFSQYRKESGWVRIPESALDKQKRST